MAITRKISVQSKALVAPINYVYGETAISIVLTLTDFTIPTGATAAVYASVPGGSVYTQTATISGNDITISPVSGLFQPGKNAVQVEVSIGNKKLITFALTVNCENQLSETGSSSASSVRTSAQIDADVSQIKEDILALQAGSGSGSGSGSSGTISGTGWTSAQITLLETVLQNLAYSSASAGQTAAASLISSLRGNSSSGGSSDSGGSSSGGTDTPDTPTTHTLSSISVSYSGGSVDAGTATSSLSITVTATYSDSSTQAVTSGYTLYPTTIAEGSNTVTVTYQGKNASFTVTGNAVSTETDTSPVIARAGWGQTTGKVAVESEYTAITADYDISNEPGAGTSSFGTIRYYFKLTTETDQIFNSYVNGKFKVFEIGEDGSVLEYWSQLRNTSTTMNAGRYNGTKKVRFVLSNNEDDQSYSWAYCAGTGNILFAGRNTEYYGKSNIND